jgi:hypothetical protein
MGFAENDVNDLLTECHRRCCICHRFCGVKMEIDHIDPWAASHNDTIDNAIAVCFDCHAEIHLYNPAHPRGRKFRSTELRLHRDQWLDICRSHPEVFAASPVVAPAGTIGALDQEIDFNLGVARHTGIGEVGCPFSVTQFDRAVADGTYSILSEELREKLREAYRLAKLANTLISGMPTLGYGSDAYAEAWNQAAKAVGAALKPFSDLKQLMREPFDLLTTRIETREKQ